MEKWYDTGHFLQGLQLNFTYFTHKKTSEINSEVSEASTGIEPVIEVLQTFALPLGYDAIFLVTPTGIEPVLPPWKGDVLTAWPRSLNETFVWSIRRKLSIYTTKLPELGSNQQPFG